MNWLNDFFSRKTEFSVDEAAIRKDEHGLDNVDDFWSACSVSGSAKVPVSPPIPSDESSDEQTTRVKELLHSPTERSSPSVDPVLRMVTQRSRPSSEQRRTKHHETKQHESTKVKPLHKQLLHPVDRLDDDYIPPPPPDNFPSDSPPPPELEPEIEPEIIQKPKRKAKSQKVKPLASEIEIDMPRPPAELIDIIDAEREASSKRKQKRGPISLFPDRPTEKEPEEDTPRPTSVFSIAPAQRIEMERTCFRKKDQPKTPEPKESPRKATRVRQKSPSPEPPKPDIAETPRKQKQKTKPVDDPPINGTPRPKKRPTEQTPPVKGTPRPKRKERSAEQPPEDPEPARIKKTAKKTVIAQSPEKLKSTPKAHTPVSRAKKTDQPSTPKSSRRSEPRSNFRVSREWSRDVDKKYEVLSDDDSINEDDVVTVPDPVQRDDGADLPIAMRRTKRVKVKPLRFWLGERIIYRLGDGGLPGFESVKLTRDDQSGRK